MARVRGVRSITNDLKVCWSESTNDDLVKQHVVNRLNSNATTRPVAGHIQVVVKSGAVTLTGRVDRSFQLIDAERIANSTDGVRTVENRLSVGKR